jgi:aminoglycoside phosphotransferase (APT) family kinase protein
MPNVSATERQVLWSEAVRTLAKLNGVDPDFVGQGNLGRREGCYDRQVRTWKTICAGQSGTKDVETREPLGALPYMEEMVTFFRDERPQPANRGTRAGLDCLLVLGQAPLE